MTDLRHKLHDFSLFNVPPQNLNEKKKTNLNRNRICCSRLFRIFCPLLL